MADHDFYNDEPPHRGMDEFDAPYEGHQDAFDDHPPAPQVNGGLQEEEPFGQPAANGSVLPPPEEMGADESMLLRQWRQKRAQELEEKEQRERSKHGELLESATEQREHFYEQRDKQIAAAKDNNREKEKVFIANVESLAAKAESNYWEAVSGYVNFEMAKPEKKTEKARGTPRPSVVPEVKAGRSTDLSRFRQVLLKLKHTPPIKA